MLLKMTIAMLIMFAIALAGEWTLATAFDSAVAQNAAAKEQRALTDATTKAAR